uniref:PcAst-3_Astacidin n=1 Tax=Procambarus clarkii TaxID=6728 RepID=A0A6G6CHX5_PROCL|nr:PcAst-3_Astacidin [Procambarus clarkii]
MRLLHLLALLLVALMTAVPSQAFIPRPDRPLRPYPRPFVDYGDYGIYGGK